MTIKYKRVLLKLSGEALQGSASNLDPDILNRLAADIKVLVELGVEVGVVVGGGNLFRGAELAAAGMNRVMGDQMGMLATAMNGLAISDALHRAGAQSLIMSSIPLQGISDAFSHTRAIAELVQKRVVIFVGGTGNPFFTTDSAACLRGIEIQADVVLKATKVDGVYTADPAIYPDAERYQTLSFDTVLQKELKVMDMAAFVLARDHKMPIRVFNMNQTGVLQQIVKGDAVSTLIHPESE